MSIVEHVLHEVTRNLLKSWVQFPVVPKLSFVAERYLSFSGFFQGTLYFLSQTTCF